MTHEVSMAALKEEIRYTASAAYGCNCKIYLGDRISIALRVQRQPGQSRYKPPVCRTTLCGCFAMFVKFVELLSRAERCCLCECTVAVQPHYARTRAGLGGVMLS